MNVALGRGMVSFGVRSDPEVDPSPWVAPDSE